MNSRFHIVIGLLILQFLTACAFGSGTLTPTVVPLEQTGTALNPTKVVKTWPTPTPIPLPSPTPSPTPLSLPSLFTPTPIPTAASPLVEVIVIGLNVRQGPGLAYPVIGTAAAGDEFPVIGLDPNGDWLQVVTESGEPGWVSAESTYTRLFGVDLDELPFVEPPLTQPKLKAPPIENNADESGGLDGRLVFATSSGGELYVVNIDGTGLQRLADGVIDPAVSPDCQQVAFVRWDGAAIGTLYTINLDGTGERAVAGDILQPKSPTWSPNGREIILAFQHGGLRDPEEKCKEYDFDDGIRAPKNGGEITKFRISGDGVVICSIPKEDLKWNLRRIEVESGQFEDLPADDYSYNPAWDPRDPWRVVYDGQQGLIQFDVNNNSNWPITTDRRDTGPVFSLDGKKLALTYAQHDHWEVYTLDLETGVRHRLTKPPILADPQYNSAAPAWSPDGTQLAFLTDRTGRWEIWTMGADGSNQRPLLSPELQVALNLQYRGVNERMLNWTE